MKKILAKLSSKVLLFSSIGLTLSLYGFWNYQQYQTQINQLHALNNGVNTCFQRVNQTFTAMMIAQARSPYLDKEFIGLSDECLSETNKMVKNPKQILGKNFDIHQQLISETHWFHEKVNRLGINSAIEKGSLPPTTILADRYSKLETFKMDLTDGIDLSISEREKIQMNTEYLMGAGLLLVVFSLMMLGLRDFDKAQLHKEIEAEALNLLKTDMMQISSLVDRLMTKSLEKNDHKILAQLFKDYHEHIIEKNITKTYHEKPIEIAQETTPIEIVVTPEEASSLSVEVDAISLHEETSAISVQKISLLQTIDHLKNVIDGDLIETENVKDYELTLSQEDLAQILSASVTKMKERSHGQKKIHFSTIIDNDKVALHLFQPESTFHAFELDYFESSEVVMLDSMDINLVLLKEMTQGLNLKTNLENCVNENGIITGMLIKIKLPVVMSEEKPKNLVSVIRGKKKDLFKEIFN